MRPLGVNVRGLHSKLNVMDNSLIKLEKGALPFPFRRCLTSANGARTQLHTLLVRFRIFVRLSQSSS